MRVVIGLALLSMLFLLHGDARWLGPVVVVPPMTAASRFCPPYLLVGAKHLSSSGEEIGKAVATQLR